MQCGKGQFTLSLNAETQSPKFYSFFILRLNNTQSFANVMQRTCFHFHEQLGLKSCTHVILNSVLSSFYGRLPLEKCPSLVMIRIHFSFEVSMAIL